MPPRSRRPSRPGPPGSITPQELADEPALAVLVALQQLLELTGFTLAAIHPDLVGDRSHLRPLDPQAVLADQIVRLGARLVKATNRYRAEAIARLHAPDTDDLPR